MQTCLSSFVDELEKISAETNDSDVPAAVASGAGGAYALSKAVPRVTGRTKYYHGTARNLAEKIKEKGLLPASQTKVEGVIAQGGFPKEWGEKAYVARSPTKARLYGFQSAQREMTSPELLQISLPEWKEGLKTVENPETAGGFKAWRQRTLARMEDPKTVKHLSKQMFGGGAAGKQMAQQQIEATKKMLDSPVLGRLFYKIQSSGGERAVSKIPTQYIKGTKDYSRLGLREVLDYMKARPGRFASGVGLGMAGLAGLGYGAHRLFGGKEK